LLNRNKYIGEEFFVFYKFAFPSILLLILALRCLDCYLSFMQFRLWTEHLHRHDYRNSDQKIASKIFYGESLAL